MKNHLKALWRLMTLHSDPYGLEEMKRIRQQAEFWDLQYHKAFDQAIQYLKVSDIKNFDKYYEQANLAKKRFDREAGDKIKTL